MLYVEVDLKKRVSFISINRELLAELKFQLTVQSYPKRKSKKRESYASCECT